MNYTGLKLRGIHVERLEFKWFHYETENYIFYKTLNKHLPKDDERRETNKCGPL